MLSEVRIYLFDFYQAVSIWLTWPVIIQMVLIILTPLIIYSQFLCVYHSPLNYLPSVPFCPVLGSLPEIMRSETGEFGERWMKNLNASVFRYFWLFGSDRVMVCDADIIKEILVNKSNIYQKPKHRCLALNCLLGDGLLTSDGEIHSRNRNICKLSFKLSSLNEFVALFEKAGNKLINIWLTELKKMQCKNDREIYNEIPVMCEMSNLTLDVLSKVVFDYDLNAIEDRNNELTDHFHKFVEEFKFWSVEILHFLFSGEFAEASFYCYGQRAEKIDEIVYEMIRKKRHELEMLEEDTEETNLLADLIRAKDQDARLSDKQIRDEIFTFLLAGHGTTSAGLTWVLHQLAKYPEIQSKVRDEVRSVLSPTGESFTEEPLTEKPVTGEPLTGESLTEEPLTDEPLTGEPITGESRTRESLTEEPITVEPLTRESLTEESLTGEPLTEEPLIDEPLTDEPITGEPLTGESLTRESLTEEPLTGESLTGEPLTDEPITREPLTSEHLDRMTYLTCVIKETLRLFPPIPMLIRRATQDNQIDKYFFPKGSKLKINIISLHRNPKYWDDPHLFRPERFQKPDKIYPYSFIPFNGGTRMCIAYKFALMKMKTVLALLVNKFEFLHIPRVIYRRKMTVTMRPEPKLRLKVKIAD